MSDHNPVMVVNVQIAIDIETDEGADTPDAWEPPYDYTIVSEATVTDIQRTAASRRVVNDDALAAAVDAGVEDSDPDGTILRAVNAALVREAEGRR